MVCESLHTAVKVLELRALFGWHQVLRMSFLSGNQRQFDFDLMVEVNKKTNVVKLKRRLTSVSPDNLLEKADQLDQLVQDTQKLVSLTFARPDDLTMPDLGQKLLPFMLHKKLRAAVAGDLAEDFRTFATKWGRPYALRWLWWELSGLFIRRFGPTAIITAVGMWFRQKLGW